MGNVNQKIFDFMKNDLEVGLYEFGHYNFTDKGTSEVCQMATNELRDLPVEDAVATLQAFFNTSDDARQYVQDHIYSLQEWDELFDEKAPWHEFVMDNY